MEPQATNQMIQQSLTDEGATGLKDWPGQNPVLNIIKQMWTELEKSLSEESMQSWSKENGFSYLWR